MRRGDVWRLLAGQLAAPPGASMGSAASRSFGHRRADAAGPTSPCQDITEGSLAKRKAHPSNAACYCPQGPAPTLFAADGERGASSRLAVSAPGWVHRALRSPTAEPSRAMPDPHLPISLLGGGRGRSRSLPIPPSYAGYFLPDPAEKGPLTSPHRGRKGAKHLKGQLPPSHPPARGSPTPQPRSTHWHPAVSARGTRSSTPGWFLSWVWEGRGTPGRGAARFRAGFRQPGTRVYFGF